jgi:hypothetical protein
MWCARVLYSMKERLERDRKGFPTFSEPPAKCRCQLSASDEAKAWFAPRLVIVMARGHTPGGDARTARV